VGILAEHFSASKSYQFDEPEVTSKDPIRKHFKSLYSSRSDTGDITIIAGDKRSIKAHKCILWGHSKSLDELVASAESNNQTIVIDEEKFPLATAEAFEEIIKFFYFDFTGLELTAVCRMFKFARDMELTKLYKCMEHIISTVTISSRSIPFALDVALNQLHSNPNLAEKLRERTLNSAVQHFTDIPISCLSQMDPSIGTLLIRTVQSVLQDYISKGVEPSYFEMIEKTNFNYANPTGEESSSVGPNRARSKGKPRRKSQSLKV